MAEVVFMVLVALGLLVVVIVGAILGIVAFRRTNRLNPRHVEDRLRDITQRLHKLEQDRSSGGTSQALEIKDAEAKPEAPSRILTLDKAPPAHQASQATPPLAESADVPVPPAARADTGPRPAKELAGIVKDIATKPADADAGAAAPRSALRPAPKRVIASEGRPWWTNLEEKAGKLWMTWAGAVALILAVGFFSKYAFDQGWLRPGARVIAGLVFGVILAGIGERFCRRGMKALGQGLIGAGLAILYVSLYAASVRYGLLGRNKAFMLMALVTAGGMALAVVRDAPAISVLALLGGILTPLILEADIYDQNVIFPYLIILDVGALGVAFFKKWRVLDILAFVSTWFFYARWFNTAYEPTAMWPAISWAGAFYWIFLVMPFVNHFRKGKPIPVERFLMALVNAGVFFAFAWETLSDVHEHILGFIVLLMAACYCVGAAFTRRRIKDDEVSLFGFTALALSFLTISGMLHFKVHGLTLFWAVEAPLLVYLGHRFRYLPVRIGGLIVLFLVFGRLFYAHSPLHDGDFTVILNREFATALLAPASAFAFAFVHHRFKEEACASDRLFQNALGIAGGLLLLGILHAELSAHFEPRSFALAEMAGVSVWAAGAVAFVLFGAWAKTAVARTAGLLPLLIAMYLQAGAYSHDYQEPYRLLLNTRFAGAAAAVSAAFVFGLVLWRLRDRSTALEISISRTVRAGAVLLGGAFLSSEFCGYFLSTIGNTADARLIMHMFVSVVWPLTALVLLVEGIRLASCAVRTVGSVTLALSGVLALALYAHRSEAPYALIFNARFGVSLVSAAAIFVFGLVLWRRREKGAAGEAELSKMLHAAAVLLAGAVLSSEFCRYFLSAVESQGDSKLIGHICVSVVWPVVALLLLIEGIRLASCAVRTAGAVTLALGTMLALALYAHRPEAPYMLFANARFAASILSAAAVLLYARVFWKRRGKEAPQEKSAVKVFVSWAVVFVFIILSLESFLYFRHSIEDFAKARWMSQAGLTVTWGAYAAAMLSVGFWKRLKPLRIAALVLFASTSVKLLIVDIAGVKQVWRIVAFFVMGLLMMGAAYLYHKLERLLDESATEVSEEPPAER